MPRKRRITIDLKKDGALQRITVPVERTRDVVVPLAGKIEGAVRRLPRIDWPEKK